MYGNISNCGVREGLANRIADQTWQQVRPLLVAMICRFLAMPINPQTFRQFEQELSQTIRLCGRILLEQFLAVLEPSDPEKLPHDILWEGDGFRRLKAPMPNRFVATLFGTIVLHRHGYRSWHTDVVNKTIFPLELCMGLVDGITPALSSAIGQQVAQRTQRQVLAWLDEEHGVKMGVKRLREHIGSLSGAIEPLVRQCQVKQLLEALDQATKSSGNRKPVLSVGRDGVTLFDRKTSSFQTASVATVSVLDRRGKRLTTVYLGQVPEPNQKTLTAQLTGLVLAVLREWKGHLPRLSYVTDSGSHETSYYERVLRRMQHPRTGERLTWHRVVDFYHVAQRVWTIAECIFGKDSKAGKAWARRMLKLLKKRNGVSRVLHSIGALASSIPMSKKRRQALETARRYIRERTKYMRYHEYKQLHIPLGSGVTEAACKILFTQRLKLSGMGWKHEGASRVVTLRACLLSHVWDQTFEQHLEVLNQGLPQPYRPKALQNQQIAA